MNRRGEGTDVSRLIFAIALVVPIGLAVAEENRSAIPDEDIESRSRWFAERRRSATGEDPTRLRARSLDQLRENLASNALVETDAGDIWVAVGPSPLLDAGRPFTGRISAIAPHPSEAGTVWVGTANGGVWKTSDGGSSWTATTDLEDTLAIGAIAIDGNNPQIVWVGTGEANAPFCPVYGGMGLLKTTDGGASWTPFGRSTFLGSGISGIVLHPTSPLTLWVANRVAQRGSGVCETSAGPHGVFRSLDGGANWTQVLGPAQTLTDGSVSDLQISPSDPNRLLAGVVQSGVWRSIDGGGTWSRAGNGLPTPLQMGRVEIAFDPVDASVVYVSMEAPDGSHLGVWKSTNGGLSFSALPKPGPGSCHDWAIDDLCTYTDFDLAQCFFYHDIGVAPDRDVWVAGLGVARSGDGGSTWSQVCRSNVHVDQHALGFGADGRVWLGNDGGVMSTSDDGATWTAHNAGLDVAQFYPGPSAHPTNPAFALGGTQDNGTLKFTGDTSWTMVTGGDRWRTSISADLPDTTWYSSGGVLYVYKTTDAGETWSLARDGIPSDENAATDAPWIVCPDDADVFIGISDNVWRTDDAMGFWTANSPDPLEADFVYGTSAGFLAAGNGCDVYFAGFRNGALWRTLNGGASWTKIGTFPGIVSDLHADPRAPATLWVTLQKFGVDHVWRSSNVLDAVPIWEQRDAGIPDTPVNAVSVDRRRAGVVWLGTDLGIFRSEDDGMTWSNLTAGHPRAIVMGFATSDGTRELYSFTHGRGAFRLDPDCGGACPPVADTVTASKGSSNATYSWDAVSCAALDRYVVYGAPDFSAAFPSGWTVVGSGPGISHVEPLSSPNVAFRVVTENACGDRSN
jgi:photosystem II stability/assembly factor-like uncharacterized protein